MSQESWQKVFEIVGRDAPRPLANEGSIAYERRMSTIAQKYVRRADQISRVDFNTIPQEALRPFVNMVQEALVRDANSPLGMRPGEFRPVIDVDQNTGAKTKRWIGPRPFTDDAAYGNLPARRVTRINAPAQNVIYDSKRESRGLW
jgi:hypothetical protein